MFVKNFIKEQINNILQESMIFQHGKKPHQEVSDFKPKLKPLIMYKQFKLRLDKNGNNMAKGYVFPLYVNTDENSGRKSKGLKLGVWYKSGSGECWLDTDNNRLYTKGSGYGTDGNTINKLAYRAGWHLTTTPWGNQRGDDETKVNGQFTTTRNSEVWAKVEICVDIDATERAKQEERERAKKENRSYDAKYACFGEIDNDTYYKYKTNINATDDQSWYIVDKIRIIDILDDDEVDNINGQFYGNLSAKTNRKIQSNPSLFADNERKRKEQNEKNKKKKNNQPYIEGDIPYWKMPRTNGKRYTKDELSDMGYTPQDETQL